MKVIKILPFLLLVLALSFSKALQVIKIKPGANISNKENGKLSHLGIVKGVRSCGGQAKVIQWRYESCTNADSICHVPTDGKARISQVDFIPKNNVKLPAFLLIVKSNDGNINDVVDGSVITSKPVVANGSPYTLTVTGGVSEELKGKDAVFQYILYDLNDNRVEFCSEANIQYD